MDTFPAPVQSFSFPAIFKRARGVPLEREPGAWRAQESAGDSWRRRRRLCNFPQARLEAQFLAPRATGTPLGSASWGSRAPHLALPPAPSSRRKPHPILSRQQPFLCPAPQLRRDSLLPTRTPPGLRGGPGPVAPHAPVWKPGQEAAKGTGWGPREQVRSGLDTGEATRTKAGTGGVESQGRAGEIGRAHV